MKKKIEGLLNEGTLQRLTRNVIELHREGNDGKLLSMAVRAGLVSEGETLPPRSVFYRMVRTVHPDQLPFLRKRLAAASGAGDLPELGRIHSLLSVSPASGTGRTRPIEPREYREEHVWDSGEWGFYGDADEESRWDEAEELTFLDAVKLYAVGNLDIELSPFELAQLDGTLDVSRCGLFDLDGAELCVHVSILDASENGLTSVAELSEADNLVELYLSGNGIGDISPLAGLASLEILDLEGNEVEDISPLLEIPELRFVNLRGNPVEKSSVPETLAERGVVVLLPDN